MVKRDLAGRVSTTIAVSYLIIRQIYQASCGVMLRIAGELVACDAWAGIKHPTLRDSDGVSVSMAQCRIHRSTVLQIRAMIGC